MQKYQWLNEQEKNWASQRQRRRRIRFACNHRFVRTSTHTHSTATAIESESNGRGGESYVGHEHSPMNKCLTAPFQDSSIFPGWNQIWLGVISNPDEFLDDSIKLEKWYLHSCIFQHEFIFFFARRYCMNSIAASIWTYLFVCASLCKW